MKNFAFALVIFVLQQPVVHAQPVNLNYDSLHTRTLTPDQMKADFSYLRKALEETHPGLYRYNDRRQISDTMDSLYNLFATEMKFYAYYKLLALLVSKIRCAHTTVLPSPNLQNLLATCKTFPYWVFLVKEKIYITASGTADTLLKPGSELLSVNGRSVDTIRQIIFEHLWSDGYIEISKQRMLDENYFSLFYYFFVEQPDSFSIKCRTARGEIIEHTVSAQTLQVSLANLSKNTVNKELLKAHATRNKLNQEKPWRVEINNKQDAAIMTITGFGGGNNGDEAAKKMRTFMDACMDKIKKSHVDNLIVDLRLNHGGWDNQGEELFTYLIDTPVYYYHKFHAVTDSSAFLQFSSISKEELKNIKNELTPEKDGSFTVKKEFNATLLVQYPKSNRFSGKIYFLMDGASGSTTAEFLAAAHANKLGTFIGEECAGNYTGGNGGEFISLLLPKTNIQVSIPLLYYENAVDKPLQEGRGTMPDYTVPYNIKDIITGTDTQLNFAYELIKKRKNKTI